MRLTQLTDYAMRLLIHLAQHPQRLCTIAEVAGRYGVSEAHLVKVTHRLGRAGWIVTMRGKGGGIRLAHEPKDIGLGAVVRSMEPDFFLVECLSGGNTCMLTGTCKLTGVVDGALRSFMQYLDGHTLVDRLPGTSDAAASQVIRFRRPARALAS
jgi:Rrf2 family transcriptional regulator, nitric oxide-sensitive transcriptional repressor